jgi:hypothetical protein
MLMETRICSVVALEKIRFEKQVPATPIRIKLSTGVENL